MAGSSRRTIFTVFTRTSLGRKRTHRASIKARAIDSISKGATIFTVAQEVRARINTQGNRTQQDSSVHKAEPSIAMIPLAVPNSASGPGMHVDFARKITGTSGIADQGQPRILLVKPITSGPSSRHKKASIKTQTSISSSRPGTGRRRMLRGAPIARPNTAGTSPVKTQLSIRRIASSQRRRSRAPSKHSSKEQTCSRSIAKTRPRTTMGVTQS